MSGPTAVAPARFLPLADGEEWIYLDDLAARLHVSGRTLRRAWEAGKMPHGRSGLFPYRAIARSPFGRACIARYEAGRPPVSGTVEPRRADPYHAVILSGGVEDEGQRRTVVDYLACRAIGVAHRPSCRCLAGYSALLSRPDLGRALVRRAYDLGLVALAAMVAKDLSIDLPGRQG